MSDLAYLETKNYKFGMGHGGRLRADLAETVHRFSTLIETRIKTSMAAPKSGRMYTGPGGKVYQASAPGEPPAVRSGKLFESVKTKTFGFGLEAEIGVFPDGPPYAEELERGLGGFQARPYVVPALEAYEREFVRSVELVVATLGLFGGGKP